MEDDEFNKIQIMQKNPINPQSTLLQILQSIFDDITIYNNPKLRQLITNNPKGFIPLSNIYQFPIYKNFIQKNPQINTSIQQIIHCINTSSKKLIISNFQIRRIHPFIDKIKNKKMTIIYIESIPSTQKISDVYNLIQSIVGIVYKIYYKSFQKWAFILIDNYQALQLVKDNLFIQDKKLLIKTPQQSLSVYGQKQRMDGDYSCVRIYQNKNIYQATSKNGNDDSDQHSQDSLDDKDQIHHLSRQMIQQQLFVDHKNYKSKHDRQQFKHRKLQMECQQKKLSDRNKIDNFNNSPLLSLRN